MPTVVRGTAWNTGGGGPHIISARGNGIEPIVTSKSRGRLIVPSEEPSKFPKHP